MADEEQPTSTWGLVARFGELMRGAPDDGSHFRLLTAMSPDERVSGPWNPDHRKTYPSRMVRQPWGEMVRIPERTVGALPLWQWLTRGGGTGEADRQVMADIHSLWADGLRADGNRRQSRIWQSKTAELGIFLEDPPRRDAPTEVPEISEKNALGLFVDAYQQSGWWWQARSQEHMKHLAAHSRTQWQGWKRVRDAAEPIARSQLDAAIGYLTHHKGTPFVGVSEASRKLVGSWS